jgi:hypothetical protein
MTKYTARVTRVLQAGIHCIGAITENGDVKPVSELPLPDYVQIECEGTAEKPCVMYRYADSGEFCGDTWHETMRDAFEQASFEYGLAEADFSSEPTP